MPAEHSHTIVSCLVQLTSLFRSASFSDEMLGCLQFLMNTVFNAIRDRSRSLTFGTSQENIVQTEEAVAELYRAVHGSNAPLTFTASHDKAFGAIGDGAILSMLLPLLLKLFELWLSKQKP